MDAFPQSCSFKEDQAMWRRNLCTAAMCVVLVILAGSLRFYRLGEWPFHADELATMAETASLFDGMLGSGDSQIDRLPRFIPLSHLVHRFDYLWFGQDEFGSRVLMAILGTMTPLLVFLGLAHSLGRTQAFIAALLLAFWPEHVYYSQENRFYSTAFLTASLCTLAGSQAVARRSIAWTVTTCLLGVAGLFTHTILALLLPSLFLAVLLAGGAGQRSFLIRALATVAVFLGVVGLVYVFYIRPMFGQFNSFVGWDYSSLRSLGNSLFHLGWPIALLSGFGAALALLQREQQDRYWLTWAAIWAGSSVVLPQFLHFRPAYSFPLALAILVLAAKGIDRVYRLLAERSWISAAAWVALACLLNFPSLASHYIDGSCSNYKAAAHFLRDKVQPDDALLAVSADLLKHYLPDAREPLFLELYVPETAIAMIERQRESSGRVWVVLNYGRATRPNALLAWLRTHGSQEFTWCRMRYDCFEYTTDVFLLTGEPGSVRGRVSLPVSPGPNGARLASPVALPTRLPYNRLNKGGKIDAAHS